ncbi:hypothetical protein [Streptomyces sp. NPDC002276]
MKPTTTARRYTSGTAEPVPVAELTARSAAILAEAPGDALVVEDGHLTDLGRAWAQDFVRDLAVAANRMPNPQDTMRQIIAVLPEMWETAAANLRAEQAGAGA